MSTNSFFPIKDVSLSPAEVADIKNHLSLIEAPLDFAVGLSLDERARMTTINQTNKLFVTDIADAVDSIPEILPRYIDQSEWGSAWDLFRQMEDLEVEVGRLLQMVRHTRILSGAKLYQDGREIYKSLKAAYFRGLPGVEPFYHRAKRRYDAQRTPGNQEPTNDDVIVEDIEVTQGPEGSPEGNQNTDSQ